MWTIAFGIWVKPVSIGISLSCLAELFLFVSYIALSSSSGILLGKLYERINAQSIKSSWLQTKKKYLSDKGKERESDIVSYNSYFEKYKEITTQI